jgi:hypothetical protein
MEVHASERAKGAYGMNHPWPLFQSRQSRGRGVIIVLIIVNPRFVILDCVFLGFLLIDPAVFPRSQCQPAGLIWGTFSDDSPTDVDQ